MFSIPHMPTPVKAKGVRRETFDCQPCWMLRESGNKRGKKGVIYEEKKARNAEQRQIKAIHQQHHITGHYHD